MRIVGHRGAAGLAPENTLASFEAALAAGADAVELDARLTADGRIVLMHDDDVSRATGGSGRISQMTLDDVRALDASASFPGWVGPARVPTLEEILDLTAGRCGVVVELKATFLPDSYLPATPVARAVAPLVAGVPGVVVSSFDQDAIAEARVLLPGVPTAVTTFAFVAAEQNLGLALEGGHEECHVAEKHVDAGFIERAHAAGRRVYAWTVNDPGRLRVLRDVGIDGVFTDDPAAARAALADRPTG